MNNETQQADNARLLPRHSGLYTDFYELTMAQGYFLTGRQEEPAVFDYFFRSNPFAGGFVVFAGLQDLLEVLEGYSFGKEDIAYLRSVGFDGRFLEYLSTFTFKGNIHAAREGEVVFPYEPVLRVEGTLLEAQLIETIVLNLLNFESLIATKAARIRLVAGERVFVDFGMRRAQGFGSVQASRAAAIGGADGTSNVYAGLQYGLKVTGTQAHSWIQGFGDELTAFREFARLFPDNCVLLVDTYDTLKSGIPNCITVAKEMESNGHRLQGIRLDSGDLAYLSKKARKMLNSAGLDYVKIIVSNQLDEYLIRSLDNQGAPIDGYGIGTRLATGQPSAALDGVYKLSMSDNIPRLKLSENVEKISLPGMKKVIRLLDEDGQFAGDGIFLEEEEETGRIFHPHKPDKFTELKGYQTEHLMSPVMLEGEMQVKRLPVSLISQFVKERLSKLPDEHKRFEYPHIYKVGISEKLMHLRNDLAVHTKSSHL